MFIYTLPMLFTQIRLVSPGDALIIMLGMWLVIFMTLPPVERLNRQAAGNYLFSAWTGDSHLSRVFWPFFLILNGCLYSLDSLAKSGHFTVSSWDDLHFVLLFPIVWWTVGVWRCSAHTGSKMWAASACLATISVALEYALKLYIRIEYPRLFFNCENVMLDYGSCF